MRWFTPTVEVDLCGHATLATAHILFDVYHHVQDIVQFHTKSGLLTVAKKDGWLTLNFPADELQAVETPKAITDALNISLPEVYKGKTDYMVVLSSQQQVEALTPDFRLLATLRMRGVPSLPQQEKTLILSLAAFIRSLVLMKIP